MRSKRLTWTCSELQAVQLAVGFLESVNIPWIRRKRRYACLAMAIVTHDRILTQLRPQVHRD